MNAPAMALDKYNNSASRAACAKAEKACNLKCAITAEPENGFCESVCLNAYDTCLQFADVLEPAKRTSGKRKRKQSPYASDVDAEFYRQ